MRRVAGGERLEFPIGTVIAEPSMAAGGFSFPRVSPRGDRVAVFELAFAGELTGRVVTVDRGGQRRSVPREYFNCFGLAWNGSEIWFTAADERPLFRNVVHAISSDGTTRVVARVAGNVSLHDIAPDGRVLMAHTDDRTGMIVLAPGDTLERDLSWLDFSSPVDISHDGTMVLFVEGGVGGGPRGTTYLRSTDGSPAVRLLDQGGARALSPDGRWALFIDDAGALVLLPTGPGEPRRIEPVALTYLDARWLPDRTRVIVRAQEQNRTPRLFVLDTVLTRSSRSRPKP